MKNHQLKILACLKPLHSSSNYNTQQALDTSDQPPPSLAREDFFHELAKGMSGFSGEDRLSGFIFNLGRFFEGVCLFAVEHKVADQPAFELLRCVFRAGPLPISDYPAKESVCAHALETGILILPAGALQHFPTDAMLRATKAEAIVLAPLRRSDGQIHALLGLFQTSPFDDEEFPLEIISMFVEPTSSELERLRQERELAEHRSLFQDLANSIPGAIFQIKGKPSGNGRLTVLSQGAGQLWNQTADELLQQCAEAPDQLIHKDDRDSVLRSFTLSEEFNQPLQCLFRIPERTPTIWVQALAQIRRSDEGSPVWTGLFTDVTALKNAQRDLELARRNADLESAVLDSLNRHQSLQDSADTLARGIEAFWEQCTVLILLPQHPGEEPHWSAPSCKRSFAKDDPPLIPENLLVTSRPTIWNLHQPPIWNHWKDIISQNCWSYAASCRITGINTPPGGYVLLFFAQLPDCPPEKILQILRRFAYSASLVDRYGRRSKN